MPCPSWHFGTTYQSHLQGSSILFRSSRVRNLPFLVEEDPSCVGADASPEVALVPSWDQTVVVHEIWDHEVLQNEEVVALWMVVPLDHNLVHGILAVHVLEEDLLVVQSREVPRALYFLYRKGEKRISLTNRKIIFLTRLSKDKNASSSSSSFLLLHLLLVLQESHIMMQTYTPSHCVKP